MQGDTPSVTTAMHLFHTLSEASNHQLRVPVALETQLLGAQDMDTEVGRSMWELLRVGPRFRNLRQLLCAFLHYKWRSSHASFALHSDFGSSPPAL